MVERARGGAAGWARGARQGGEAGRHGRGWQRMEQTRKLKKMISGQDARWRKKRMAMKKDILCRAISIGGTELWTS